MSEEVVSETVLVSYPDLEFAFTILTRYIPLIIILFGIPGNCMTLTIVMRKHNRHISATRYMAGLAIMDNIVLINLIYATTFFWRVWVDHPKQGFAYR